MDAATVEVRQFESVNSIDADMTNASKDKISVWESHDIPSSDDFLMTSRDESMMMIEGSDSEDFETPAPRHPEITSARCSDHHPDRLRLP